MTHLKIGFEALLGLLSSYFSFLKMNSRVFLPYFLGIITIVPLLILFIDALIIPFIRTLNPTALAFFKTITHLGLSWWILWPTAFFVLYCLFFTHNKPFKSFYIFATVALSGLVIQPFKWSIGRARPPLFEKEGVFSLHHFDKNAMFYSLPSGHATTAAALTTALCFLFPKYKLVFIPLGFLAVISRTMIGSHYPSDILAGTLVGIAFATVGFLWLKSVEKQNLT
jgi:membrane-associated phospholipid phosphatase